MYKIYATDTFKEIYASVEKHEKTWIDKIREKLMEYPTGKPLGYPWFREKKYRDKRLYFLIDDENKKLLLVSFSSKKEQQDIINFVKANMQELLTNLRKL